MSEREDEIGIPWPKKGDILFTDAKDWQYNACLNRFGRDWHAYTEGYRLAADTLVDHITEQSRYGLDFMVYPIVFLYRHHLELRLKTLIVDGNLLQDGPIGFSMTHKIDVLWKECRRILEDVWPEGPKEELDAVEVCIVEFCKIDPKGEGFRYPVDRDEVPILPEELERINVRHLAEAMAKMANLLDGAHCGISAYLDTKADMEQEYRAMMASAIGWPW